jgi:hypothetical protein
MDPLGIAADALRQLALRRHGHLLVEPPELRGDEELARYLEAPAEAAEESVEPRNHSREGLKTEASF